MPNAPKTCRAALLKAYREPLAVEEVPMPREIEAGAMLVKNDASSICGSDMHAWESPPPASMGITVGLPVVPGHEMMGRIADLGTVKQDSLGHPLKEGDRIIWSPGVCGRCFWCVVAKRHSLCPNRRYYGVSSGQRLSPSHRSVRRVYLCLSRLGIGQGARHSEGPLGFRRFLCFAQRGSRIRAFGNACANRKSWWCREPVRWVCSRP